MLRGGGEMAQMVKITYCSSRGLEFDSQGKPTCFHGHLECMWCTNKHAQSTYAHKIIKLCFLILEK